MGLGGPVWHASGRAVNQREKVSRRIALDALTGVGDKALGQWEEPGNGGVYHVRRRLSVAEQETFGIFQVRDIRGTAEEQERLRTLVVLAPHLAPYIPLQADRAVPVEDTR